MFTGASEKFSLVLLCCLLQPVHLYCITECKILAKSLKNLYYSYVSDLAEDFQDCFGKAFSCQKLSKRDLLRGEPFVLEIGHIWYKMPPNC